MLFNSLTFAVFLPIVFLLYWGVFGYALRHWKHQLTAQNLFVVAASYLFYGWWDWRFLLLIAFTSFCSWASGLLIAGSPSHRRVWLTANILLNLGILGIFKYYDFFVSEFGRLFGIATDGLLLQVILPVGISFYTFQAIGYTIDVYQRKLEPMHDIIAFFAFIAFFPQLVAGPIERATRLLPQFLVQRRFSFEQTSDGMRQLLWGLFKKVVIADQCAVYVDHVFGDYASYGGSSLLLAALLFTLQIYADFSGYSDMAVGTARLFGFRLIRNFDTPYFSINIADFWQRWHISLTSWFRDYVYIPLGGKNQRTRNILLVFLLSGLWHGANWTFMFWGLYHGCLLAGYRAIETLRKRLSPSAKTLRLPLLTFVLVVIGWIVFRADSIYDALHIISGIASSSLWTMPYIVSPTYIVQLPLTIAVLFLTEWLNRNRQHGLDIAHRPIGIRWTVYIVIAALIFLFGEQAETFIYFQF